MHELEAKEYDAGGDVKEAVGEKAVSDLPLAVGSSASPRLTDGQIGDQVEAEVLRCEILKRVELLAVDYWKLTNFFMKAAANNPDKVELVEKVRADIRELRYFLKKK